jgi:hypothetical protein
LIASKKELSAQLQKKMTIEGTRTEDGFDTSIRQLPNSGWPACYESIIEEKDGKQRVTHLCNAIDVFEGIDEQGQLYYRTEWGLGKVQKAPEDFAPEDWHPSFSPSNGDSLDSTLRYLQKMVDEKIIALAEHTISESFYHHLFSTPSTQ